ncbi:hypothetical protein PLESTM_000151200 [Pleodorina starrii]|nr:hypothetical protein PLESTM_000151200 [Pleodorina starrii]
MVGGRTDNAVKNRYAALCKRDSKSGAAKGAAARGGRCGRKPRASDSDAGASDVEIDDDSDDAEDAKRASSSSPSREPSPVRGGRGRSHHAVVDSAVANSTPPLLRGGPNAASSPLAKAAAAGAEPEAQGSTGVRSSVLGRRRQPGGGSPPLQPEPEAAAAPGPAKRRAVLQGGGGAAAAAAAAVGSGTGIGRPTVSTPPTPLVQVPHVQQQQQEGLPTGYQQQQHQQQPRPGPERLGLGGRSGSAGGAVRVPEMDCLGSQAPSQQQEEAQEPIRRASSGGREGDAGACGQPKKLPLTINIPNAASAEPHAVQPPSASATVYGIEIRVLKDLLTPCEIQYVRELNDMQLPLHINVDDDPTSLAGRSTGGSTLLGAPGGEPPLTTSRQAAQNALTALFSPGSLTGGAGSDFNDVLKWFQTGFTPRSACGADDMTPRLMSRMGLTPCGLSGGGSRGGGHCVEDAGMLGTGLTPKCLLDSGSPRGGHHHSGGSSGIGGLTPQMAELSAAKRARRQVAVAAAVAAAIEPPSQEGCGLGTQSMGSGVPPLSAGGGGSSAAAAAAAAFGITSPGGMELHAGHRQLLTKLIQTAADASAQGGGAGVGVGGSDTAGSRLSSRLSPPSPSAGMVTPEPLPRRGSLTRNLSGAGLGQSAGDDGAGAPNGQLLPSGGSGGVVVMPHFTQQELLLLLEVLNSDDLQDLPPPPAPGLGQQ